MSTNMAFVAQFCLCGSKFSEPIEKDSIVHSSQLDAQDSADEEYVAEPSPKIQHNIIHRINNLDRAGSALHQTLTLLCGRLNDEEKDVALHAAKMVHQYSGEKATCQAIISNTGLVAALVQVIWSSSDSETLSLVVSTLHNLSHHRNGLLAIFRNDIIPGLVKNLESPIESMVLEVMTILENLICNQAEPEEAFCSSGGISQLLQLLQRNNVELLGRAMYFLGALAKDSPDYRNSIMAMNGVPEFLRILCTYNEEELLDDTLGVLIALSMDACNRRAIEIAGGVQILTNCMLSNSNRPILMQKCLWMMHLMAETIAFMTTMSSDELTQLLNILMVMLGASDILSVALAINTLCTLTGYGLKCLYFRQLLCRTNAVEVLIDTIIVNGADTEDISEMAVRILSNLTVQHEMAGMVRDSIRSTHDGILSIVELLIPAKQCNLIEAVVRLISNLALNRSNCEPLREAHALEHLIQLMEKAEQDLQQTISNSRGELNFIYTHTESIQCIIVEAVCALYNLADDARNKVVIRELGAIPMLIRFLLLIRCEDIQTVSVATLFTLSSNEENARTMLAAGIMRPLTNFISRARLDDYRNVAAELMDSLRNHRNASRGPSNGSG